MIIVFEIIFIILLFFSSYYIVFHLFYWFEAKKQDKEKKILKKLPGISIIIPTYNEEKTIAKTLEKLKKINYPKNKLEIIVVDDGSEDKTYEIAKKFASKRVKVFKKARKGKASALNFGIKKAKYEFVAVMDADSYLEKDTLKNCIKYFEKDVAAVTCAVLAARKKTFFEKMQNMEYMLIASMRKAEEFPNVIGATPGAMSVYRKKILKKLGGFDEKNLVEDVEIAWRIVANGYRIRMSLDSKAYSFCPSNFKKWWNQRIRWTVGGFQTLFKHIKSSSKTTSGTGAFILPFSIIGYLGSFVGIGIFFVLLITNIHAFLIYTLKSFSLGLNPFARWEFVFNPDIKFIFGFLTFLLAMVWLAISLKKHNYK
ncbi:MAG: glycosyltransferase, partial [Candidatus Aenigmarchaeota archaeon]|nr:glycosyltransferase [Candidatus Aenigmarchaeota archaeon]